MSFWDFFTGTPEKHKRVSTLDKNQQKILDQLIAALQGQGAGGAFGDSADYFRSILNDDPALMQQFMAPEMRRFNEQTIPGLAEQFAGMGSGGLSSSGFRNASVNAGTDLQERLGAIRAGLKQGAAGGLSGLGQIGLGNYSQDVMTQQGTPGLFGTIGSGIGQGIGGLIPGAVQGIGGLISSFGQSSPYGNQQLQRRGY